MKELRAMAEGLGCKVVFQRRPILWSRRLIGHVRGTFDQRHESGGPRIVITTYGRVARRALLHVFAHEVRHAIHAEEGLYPSYYSIINDRLWSECRRWEAAPRPLKTLPKRSLPDLDVALSAERDCDTWAAEFLRSRGVEPPKWHLYKLTDTAAWRLHHRFWLAGPELYSKLKGADPKRVPIAPVDDTTTGQ